MSVDLYATREQAVVSERKLQLDLRQLLECLDEERYKTYWHSFEKNALFSTMKADRYVV